jgi:BlaI family penicillinase repressor
MKKPSSVVVKSVDLTKSELRVLEVLWTEQPLTVGQVIERLQKQHDWHQNTVKTLLTRLLKKKAVARRKDGGRFFYLPLVTREATVTTESERLLNRFFDGRMVPLVAHFADRKKLSDRDIKQIEEILAKLKDGDA